MSIPVVQARPHPRHGGPALPILLAIGLGLSLLLAGCDSPACVFGGDCGPGSPDDGVLPPGLDPASLPVDGQWIVPGAPVVTQTFPVGTDASVTSPVVLFFSESMGEASLAGAFELVQELDTPPGGDGPPQPLEGALVGDGRVLVLFPSALLPGAVYRVQARVPSQVTDLTGQLLVPPVGGVLGTFTVAEEPSPDPRVVTTWPRDGAVSASTITQVVTVFDRPLNPATVTTSSFQVVVDGLPPAFNPPPQVLSLQDFFGAFPEPRVFTWRSVDADGMPRSLGAGLPVELFLSPEGGSTILGADSQPLAPFHASFQTAGIELPQAAEILSGSPLVPSDAIGLAQLDGRAPLMILVQLAQPALAGDRLGVHIFGGHPLEPESLIVLSRLIELEEAADEVLLEEAELDLIDSAVGELTPRLADGTVAFAFRHVRGEATSPVRVLDTDPAQAGVQHPVLDIVPPEVVGLGLDGSSPDMRSNLRDLVLLGLANEEVRAVSVEALLPGGSETNGLAPPVLGSNADGGFLAAPVLLGLIDEEGAFPILVTVFDQALNVSEVFMGTFEQVGAVGPGAALPGPNILVRVLDSQTLEPIEGARVFSHEDDGGVVALVALDLTDSGGAATVASSAVGLTLVTVEADGYDLFTFQGLETSRLDVPLTPSQPGTASVALGVSSPLENLAQLEVQAADSRRPRELLATVTTTGCFYNPFIAASECGFTPFVVRAHIVGAMSLFATNPSAGNVPGFASLFLKAFEIDLPLEPIGVGQTATIAMTVPGLLDGIGADPEKAAVDVVPHLLMAEGVTGLDLGDLLGGPQISVQALAPGLPTPVYVGLGKTFQVDLSTWNVRAAYGGVAKGTRDDPDGELGELVEKGTLEADLFLEAELSDTSGNRASARPRFSATDLVLEPPGVPTVLESTVEGGSGSLAFTVRIADGLVDAAGQPGLHRVRIADAAGRGWDLWLIDPPDAGGGTALALFPDVAALGGTGLATTGAYTGRAATFAWPGLDTGRFLWTDVHRERHLSASSGIAGF